MVRWRLARFLTSDFETSNPALNRTRNGGAHLRVLPLSAAPSHPAKLQC